MKIGEIFTTILKLIFLIPFGVFFILFAGCSYAMKKTQDMDIRGKGIVRSIFGACAAISMVLFTFLGKIYE